VTDEPAQAFDSADAKTIVDTLWSNWPVVATLRPVDLGMGVTPERAIDFIRTFQQLSDAGLIGYEAFVVGPGGPQVIDAALTARGRALLVSSVHAQPPVIRQLAR
jgi:hypothetical protein